MMIEYYDELNDFIVNDSININSKGNLAVMIQITEAAKRMSFPLDPEEFMTPQGGQVNVLSGSNLKLILGKYGISKVLASEGGRTSRGSIAKMQSYVSFLNRLYEEFGEVNFDILQEYWIGKVNDFFAGKPLVLPMKQSLTVAARVSVLFDRIRVREKSQSGATLQGTVLQHLVGSKLKIITNGNVEIFGANVSDQQQGRRGDFFIKKTVIHCTTSPSDALLDKCKVNIDQGLFPIIVTLDSKVESTKQRAVDAGIGELLEVWGIAQFISTNVNEHGLFDAEDRDGSLEKIISTYNKIIEDHETDQSLKISLGE